MVSGGEDLLFIARRLMRAAAEDIGAADPMALLVATAAKEAVDFLGQPEAELHLAQAVLHLASAPKSNAVYVAWKASLRLAMETGSAPPPLHIRNAATSLMKDLGYGKGYAYDHDAPDSFSGQNYFPEGVLREDFYQPKDKGLEAKTKERLTYWRKLRAERGGG
jgi:putative ATPase